MVQKIKPALWFWLCCLALFFFLHYYPVLQLPPLSMHQGAQSDRAAVAYTFYTDGMDFFHPRVLETRAHDGICGMEFPIINYTVALLYKVFGPHDFIYRLFVLLITFSGLFAAWLITGFFIRKNLHRIFLVFGWFLSPLLVFYSANFLPDPVALSLCLWAWYYFFKFYYGIHIRNSLIKFCIFISLAGLIKVTYLIPVFVILGIFILQQLKAILVEPGIPIRRKNIGYFIFPFIPVTAWYVYAGNLTRFTQNTHFLQSIKPAASFAEFIENTRYGFNTWNDNMYRANIVYGILLILVLLFIFKRKEFPLIAWIAIFNLLGFAVVFTLFNFQFRYHDYYYIALFPTLFFACLFFQQVFLESRRFFMGLVPIAALLLFYLFPVRNLFYAKKMFSEKYGNNGQYNQTILEGTPFFISSKDSIDKVIPAGERVFVAFDPQPNISLYLLKRKGVRIDKGYGPDITREILDKSGVKYLIINDIVLWDEKWEPALKTHKKLLYKNGILSVWKI